MITWALLILGVTYATSASTIFALPRILFSRVGALAKVFAYCASCQSFWIGYALWLWAPVPWYLAGPAAMGLVTLLKGVFPMLLNNDAAFEAEQGGGET